MSTQPSPDSPGLLNWFLILALGVIWGAAFMSVRVSLEGYSPPIVAAGRIGFGALALWLIGGAIGAPLREITRTAGLRGWAYVTAIGWGAIGLPLSLLAWGQQYVPSAFAGISMGAVPLIVLPLVYLFSPEEGIGPRRIIGIILGFAGLAVLVGPGAFEGSHGVMTFWGRLACVGAATCYAVGSVMTRRAPKMPAVAFASGTLVMAALMVVPAVLLTSDLPQDFPLRPSAALLYAALLPTALAAIIRVRVITTAGSLFMSITSYMVPVWSLFFGITLLGEDLPPQIFIALALILSGIGISQSRAISAALRNRQ